jgi:hypothetical protein
LCLALVLTVAVWLSIGLALARALCAARRDTALADPDAEKVNDD